MTFPIVSFKTSVVNIKKKTEEDVSRLKWTSVYVSKGGIRRERVEELDFPKEPSNRKKPFYDTGEVKVTCI